MFGVERGPCHSYLQHTMSAVVRQLRRTAPPDVSTPQGPEPLDYCECNRGPVIGSVIVYADQLRFFPLSNRKAELGENVLYLRCVDCVADISMDVANGVIRDRMQKLARERAEEMAALMRTNEMRREAGLPIVPGFIPDGNEWPVSGGPMT